MQCPYLSTSNGKRICKAMIEQGLDGEVSDFDIQHYCQGNPVFCYHFRNASRRKTAESDAGLRSKLVQIFKTS